MRTKKFWEDVAERSLKTFAQTLVSTLGLAVAGTAIWDLDWTFAVGAALTAQWRSVLTSIGSAQAKDPESASLVAPKPVPGYVGDHRAPEPEE